MDVDILTFYLPESPVLLDGLNLYTRLGAGKAHLIPFIYCTTILHITQDS